MTIGIDSTGTGGVSPGVLANLALAGAGLAGSTPLSPLEQGNALRLADAQTGDRRATDAMARGQQRPAEECRVEVRYTPVAGGLANHAFVVTSDADSTSFFRGGPSSRTDGMNSGSSNSGSGSSNSSGSSQGSRNAGIWGTIATEYGAYIPDSTDWTTTPSGQQDVARVPGNCDRLDRAMARHAVDIAAAQISYGPLGPNSNSTAREILERTGFDDVNPVVYAPSWSIQLPMPR